jgi:thioredoxin 2
VGPQITKIAMPDKPFAIIRCNDCLQLNRIPLDMLGGKSACGSCKAALEIPRQPIWAKPESFHRMVSYWPETLLVVFTAQMCLNCKIIEPMLENLAREKAGRLKVVKVDVESAEHLAQYFKIEKTPTFLVYKNGVEVIRVDGAPKEKSDLVTWIENLLSFSSY